MAEAISPGVDAFLKGRVVTLCRPDIERDILQGGWHSWFNDTEVTEFLEHGIWPLSREKEAEIVAADLQRDDALLLSIVLNRTGDLVGVISLKRINHVLRRAEIAMVTSKLREPGVALESMALMTAHAFDRLNLDKIEAGTHEKLWKWVNALLTIGYKIEGVRRSHGVRNCEPYDVVLTGVTAADFNSLRRKRGGDILAGDVVALANSRTERNVTADAKEVLTTFNRGVVDVEGT